MTTMLGISATSSADRPIVDPTVSKNMASNEMSDEDLLLGVRIRIFMFGLFSSNESLSMIQLKVRNCVMWQIRNFNSANWWGSDDRDQVFFLRIPQGHPQAVHWGLCDYQGITANEQRLHAIFSKTRML